MDPTRKGPGQGPEAADASGPRFPQDDGPASALPRGGAAGNAGPAGGVILGGAAGTPDVGKAAFVAPNAAVTGDVSLGRDSSIWHSVTARGDLAPIRVGARTNIQDGAVLHVAENLPCTIGDDVTVGHGAIVHACTVGDRCLVGMGSIILDGARIGEESVVGAGSLVTQNKSFPPRSLIIGSPARSVRALGDEDVKRIVESAATYVELARKAGTADPAGSSLKA